MRMSNKNAISGRQNGAMVEMLWLRQNDAPGRPGENEKTRHQGGFFDHV